MENKTYDDKIGSPAPFAEYPDILTVQDLCKMLKIGRSTAYRLIQSGAIKSFKIGNNYKIPKAEVVALVSFEKPLLTLLPPAYCGASQVSEGSLAKDRGYR
jgi:excisionase family DNA binding protein